ncbi:MAG: ADP-forming succinate--CoA ligase subunit beta [Chloroflexota bacterium]
MKIHEFQAKRLLAEYGVTVPKGEVAETSDQAADITARLGGRAVIKAQILAGGRGKAGGIRLVNSPGEAREFAAGLLGRPLVTAQTGPTGVVVRRVLVEEPLEIAHELYLAVLVDRGRARPLIMASAAGGVEIEEVAATAPEKVVRVWVDPAVGFQPYLGRQVAFDLGLSGEQVRAAVATVGALYRLFMEKDCALVEVNPWVVTADGRLVAADAKVDFDDNGLFRHPEIAALRDTSEDSPLEVEAMKAGVSYVKLGGFVGCMVNGAGLAMATMDLIKLAGGEPANFLDVGGGANEERIAAAFRVLVSDPDVRVVLVNIFGGIARGDVIARGITAAAQAVGVRIPMVVRLVGTNAEEGHRILRESGLPITVAADMAEAAALAVKLAKEAAR